MQFFRPKKTSAFSMFARLNEIDPDTDEGKFCIAMMLRGGVLDGKQGWLLAVVNAQYTFNKYTELWALCRGYSEKT